MDMTATPSQSLTTQPEAGTASKKKPLRLLSRRSTAKNQNITRRNATESPLLRLPPEIRNRICGYVLGGYVLHIGFKSGRRWYSNVCLVDEDDSSKYDRCERSSETSRYDAKHHNCYKHVRRAKSKRFSLALLRACRQLHLEAALLPYTMNTLAFNDVQNVDNFVNSLLAVQRRSICKLIVSSATLGWQAMQPQTVSKLSNLTEFTFHRRLRWQHWEYIFHERLLECLEQLPLSKVVIRGSMSEDEPDEKVEMVEVQSRKIERRLLGGSEGNGDTENSNTGLR